MNTATWPLGGREEVNTATWSGGEGGGEYCHMVWGGGGRVNTATWSGGEGGGR